MTVSIDMFRSGLKAQVKNGTSTFHGLTGQDSYRLILYTYRSI
jgi:hypothetical protein